MLCKHGTNPGFAHYLFESLAAIIKTVGAQNLAMCSAMLLLLCMQIAKPFSAHVSTGSDTIPHLEGYLFPPFQEILQQDIAEFAPYVFQLFALLLELRPHPIPETYTQLLNPVLTKCVIGSHSGCAIRPTHYHFFPCPPDQRYMGEKSERSRTREASKSLLKSGARTNAGAREGGRDPRRIPNTCEVESARS
jgi:hypothetical protein